MVRLASCAVSQILSLPATSPASHLHRLLSATAAPPASPSPPPISPSRRQGFGVEGYLVGTCGLTRAQALRAATKLSHLKSPAKPDAVLAFLAGIGLSSADVTALVVKDPLFLCAGVDTTLAPNVAGLADIGLSRSEIARLASLTPDRFRRRAIVSNLPYCQALFGSMEDLAQMLKHNSSLLTSSLEKVVKPNVAFLQECGLDACDIASLCVAGRGILTVKPEHLRAMAACTEALGVPPGSGMFKQALRVVAFLSEEKVAVKVEYLKNMFRWSDAEVQIAVCKFPVVLKLSKENLKSKSQFLFSEVGLEPAHIARVPVIIGFSLEGRMKPRYYVVKFLKEHGLLECDWSYSTILKMTENVFMEKLIFPHKESAPHVAEDYAAACRGEVPISFRFR